MRGISAKRILLLATAATSLAWGQAPIISSITPTFVPAGSGDTALTVNGASFASLATQSGTSTVSLNGAALVTTFINSATLYAVVPASMLLSPTQYNVQVTNNPGGLLSNTVQFTVSAPLVPAITSISPSSVGAGSAAFTLTVIGGNIVSGSQISFNGTALSTTFTGLDTGGGSNQLTATVPANLVAAPGQFNVRVTNPSGSVSLPALFTVVGTLAITTTSLPPGTVGSTYSATLTGKGGTPPYTWTASGLPPAFSINPTTGVLSGVPQGSGTYLVTVVLRDAAGSTATARFSLVLGLPALSIAPSSSLPSGVVGVAYAGFIFASGGNGQYTFSLGSGGLPDGLALASSGAVSGTPQTPGQFFFTVVVTDSAGARASGGISITIQPAPLNITGGPTTAAVPVGAPINISFGATGGVGPYRFTFGGNLPPGTTFTNGVLSGTPTAVGIFTFPVTITDSTGAQASKDFTLTVQPPPPLSLSGTLSNGKVGVPYTAQISATGGFGPYSYKGSGLPDGLSLSASGSLSGTPGTAGKFSIAATATDSKAATANGTFSITIAPADLTVVTASLPDGAVGVPYSASLTAAGGVKPYTWTVTGLPDGVTATAAGVISGTPTSAGKVTVIVSVTDAAGTAVVGAKFPTVTFAPAALLFSTASAPNGTVGTPYSASFATTGGTPPFTFSATGLPAGLSLSAAGVISGTPIAPGAATIVVTVKDAAGVSTSKSFAVNMGLPAVPSLSLAIAGVSDTAGPLQQPRLQVTLGNTFPVDVVVTLTLRFTPDSGADDPAVQFSGGGRTTRITVPAGATNGATDTGVQTGSVAGLIAITAQMQGAGLDVTPSPPPGRTIRIAAAAPVIVPGTLTAVRNGTGFTVTMNGYATDRELTQAVFLFTAAAGSNLQTTSLTLPIDPLFAPYFGGTTAAPFGSQFTYTQPFTVTGNLQLVTSVTVTLVNRIGQSAPGTVTLN